MRFEDAVGRKPISFKSRNSPPRNSREEEPFICSCCTAENDYWGNRGRYSGNPDQSQKTLVSSP